MNVFTYGTKACILAKKPLILTVLCLGRVCLIPRSPIKPLISEVFSKFLILQLCHKPIVLKQPEVQLTRMVVYLFH